MGHVVSDQEVKIDESYVQTEREWPIHRHKSDDGAFLGTSGNYRKLVKSLVPLTSVMLISVQMTVANMYLKLFNNV